MEQLIGKLKQLTFLEISVIESMQFGLVCENFNIPIRDIYQVHQFVSSCWTKSWI